MTDRLRSDCDEDAQLWYGNVLARMTMVLGLIATLFAPRGTALAEGIGPAGETNGIAVVELFHSEGCSDCPPADDLIGKLALDSRKQKAPVYVLSHHVDYWDRLGWKDP